MKTNFKEWLKAAAIRAAKTFAQSAAASLTMTAVLWEVDWKMVLGTALLAAIVSILTSIGGLPEVELQAKLEQIEEE